MVILAIVLLSVLAFYGVFLAVMEILSRQSAKSFDAGYKLVLIIPEGAEDNLEGVIRTVFTEEIPDKLMTDGKLYVHDPGNSPQVARIIRDMQRTYPIEQLPQPDRYCIITGRGLKMSGP